MDFLTRFLAAEFGLGGRNNLESAQADEIVDAVSDLQTAMVKVFFAAVKDQDAIKNVVDKTYPAGLVGIFFLIKNCFLNFCFRPTLRKY